MMMKWTTMLAVLVVVFAGSVAWAGAPNPPGFSVDFAQCTEFVGVGPVDFATASSTYTGARKSVRGQITSQ